jgi:hypothetical protein
MFELVYLNFNDYDAHQPALFLLSTSKSLFYFAPFKIEK